MRLRGSGYALHHEPLPSLGSCGKGHLAGQAPEPAPELPEPRGAARMGPGVPQSDSRPFWIHTEALC